MKVTAVGPVAEQSGVTCARVFAGLPESVSAARAWVAGYVPGSLAADDIALLTSELVTNAILHSASRLPGGQVMMSVRAMEDMVRVDVVDQGAMPPDLTAPRDLGQGLVLVAALADVFGADGLRPVVRAPHWWWAMTTAQQRIAALEDKVAMMAAEMEYLRRDAFILRTFEEMRLQRLGYPAKPDVTRAGRPRHLHLVGGQARRRPVAPGPRREPDADRQGARRQPRIGIPAPRRRGPEGLAGLGQAASHKPSSGVTRPGRIVPKILHHLCG